MQSAKCKVNRQKALIMVFAVVNAQKQGVMGARLALTTRTTMFQECSKLAFPLGKVAYELCEYDG